MMNAGIERVVLTVPPVMPPRTIAQTSTVAIARLREAWRQADCALKSTTNAHKHHTDSGVVYGCTWFAIEHLEKAKRAIEDAGRQLTQALRT